MNNLTTFNEANLNSLASNLQNLTNQQTIILSNNEISNSTLTAPANQCQKPNQLPSKFSTKSPVTELNKNFNAILQNLKRSPIESSISLMEMQNHNSPPYCNSENSSIKSSISPGTSLSSSPTHYSTGYSNVHMLRNSNLNEPVISINQSQTSTIPLNNFGQFNLTSSATSVVNNQQPAVNFFQDKEDNRPIAIVLGKKNRHNLNDEDEEASSSIKKFCVNNDQNNQNNQNLQQQLETTSPPNQASPIQTDLRYLVQNHTFACNLNNANQLTNQLGNSNLQANNLVCNNQNTGNNNSINHQDIQQNQQQTDNANLFSTACCSNTHEDCKPLQQQETYRCSAGQRCTNSAADFRYFFLLKFAL